MLDLFCKIAYNKKVIIERPTLQDIVFLLSNLNTAIIYIAQLVSTPANGVKSLAAHQTNWAFFIGPYNAKDQQSPSRFSLAFTKGFYYE